MKISTIFLLLKYPIVLLIQDRLGFIGTNIVLKRHILNLILHLVDLLSDL